MRYFQLSYVDSKEMGTYRFSESALDTVDTIYQITIHQGVAIT